MKDGGGSAFPVFDSGVYADLDEHPEQNGMSLCQWLGGMALNGWIQVLGQRYGQRGYTDAGVADEAARLSKITADAMLKEWEK